MDLATYLILFIAAVTGYIFVVGKPKPPSREKEIEHVVAEGLRAFGELDQRARAERDTAFDIIRKEYGNGQDQRPAAPRRF